MNGRTTLIIPTVKVTAPSSWDDEQAEAIFGELEDTLDLALAAVRTKIRDVHPDLDLYWSI